MRIYESTLRPERVFKSPCQSSTNMEGTAPCGKRPARASSLCPVVSVKLDLRGWVGNPGRNKQESPWGRPSHADLPVAACSKVASPQTPHFLMCLQSPLQSGSAALLQVVSVSTPLMKTTHSPWCHLHPTMRATSW